MWEFIYILDFKCLNYAQHHTRKKEAVGFFPPVLEMRLQDPKIREKDS